MKRKTLRYLALCLVVWQSTGLYFPCAAAETIIINSEAIATSAYQTADKTRTTGRCYAAVSRAMSPLGVSLRGAAAYEAEEQLRRDSRFVPLTIYSVDDLKRGDIIVYNRSQSHPYGHIAVYQGNYKEASDHLAPVTHTKNYGGATVFRLVNEYAYGVANLATTTPAPWMQNAPPVSPAVQYKPSMILPAQKSLSRHPVIKRLLRSIMQQII